VLLQISFLGIVFDSSHAAIVKAPSIPRQRSDLVTSWEIPSLGPRRQDIVGGLHVGVSTVGYASLPSTFVQSFDRLYIPSSEVQMPQRRRSPVRISNFRAYQRYPQFSFTSWK
jgi:hypothetical protein